ncbi:MAG: transglutaminase domain-containing protein [Eubacteriales bacterium]|nr:transglutaminase domain-containing protein [Eubacteriales bacterium]
MKYSKKIYFVFCTLLLSVIGFFSFSPLTEAASSSITNGQLALMEKAKTCVMGRQSSYIQYYEETETTEEVPSTTIVDQASLDYQVIGLAFQNLYLAGYEYDIYRSISENEGYQKVCTVKESGVTWHTEMGHTYVQDGRGRILYESVDDLYLFYDQNVSYYQQYYYKVQVRDCETGQTGAYSNTASCRSELSAPAIIKATQEGSGNIQVKWLKVNGAQGYVLYRKEKGGWKKLKQLSKGKTNYTDKKSKKGHVYSYRIRAYRMANGQKTCGSYSNAYKIALKKLKIAGNYKKGSVYGPSLSSSKLQEVRQVVQNFKLNYIKKGMSDYEKVKIAHDYICVNCDYAYRGWQYHNANTAWGALVYGEAQCSGYSRAMKALCDAIGIPCHYVHANSKSANPSHQWNQVKVDGKWYIVDVQCNDSSGFYAYFLVSGNHYKATSGMQWNESKLPKTSKSNYVPK